VQLDSPISGVLTALYVASGEYAEAGEILATVSSYRRIKIALDVSETDIAIIRKGQEVRLPLTNGAHDGTKGGNYLQGTVANVSLSADPESRLFRVDLVVENPDGITKPGSLVSPQIKVAASGGGPAVPESSLLTVNGLDMVYVIVESDQSHHAELREITTGIGDGSLLAVTNGLRQGEWVVVWGQRKLSDSQKVKLHEDVTNEFFDTVKSREGLR
jgi:membrane fusion protein (multidrug efflux system)/multidrug efflux system membrane fusion protein/cobalt-zinc-cadmium efflux system membrane fusion protein